MFINKSYKNIHLSFITIKKKTNAYKTEYCLLVYYVSFNNCSKEVSLLEANANKVAVTFSYK